MTFILKKIGGDLDSSAYWNGHSADYAEHMKGAYHAHRLEVIRSVMPSAAGKSVLDFGCGDGVTLQDAAKAGASRLVGIEPNETLANVAKKVPRAMIFGGSADALQGVLSDSVDVFLALNVVAYLTQEEEVSFYREMRRVVRPGGFTVISHSNTLFDMFTLNSFTADFFLREFGVDASPLLTKPDTPARATFRVRENPLTYKFKLRTFGFEEEAQAFANYHNSPPLVSGLSFDPGRRQRDTLDWSEQDQWKLPFQCSMFVSRSVKLG